MVFADGAEFLDLPGVNRLLSLGCAAQPDNVEEVLEDEWAELCERASGDPDHPLQGFNLASIKALARNNPSWSFVQWEAVERWAWRP
jgi:hypothetical protein